MRDVVWLCVCPTCRGALAERGDALVCTECGNTYPVESGVPVLLPPYDQVHERYRRNYETMAEDDLRSPIVENRFELMHETLLRFIGDTRGKRILDVGSAYGSYLRELDGSSKVAVDLALPYLRAIPAETAIVRICGDAEQLPVRLAEFDVIIVSDVLEHLLEPERFVHLLRAECRDDARIIVHIPWRESLSQYEDVGYEFSHLRSFDEFRFRELFWMFEVRRERDALPRIDQPIVFRLKNRLPRRLYNKLVHVYFTTSLGGIEYRLRERWIRELPRRERGLLTFFEPQVKLLELRRRSSRDRISRAVVDAWARRLDAGAADLVVDR